MHDSDKREEMVGAFCGSIAALVVVLLVTEKIPPAQEPVPHAAPRCEFTIAQYGPGERWISPPRVAACALPAREVPNHVLSHPIKVQQ